MTIWSCSLSFTLPSKQTCRTFAVNACEFPTYCFQHHASDPVSHPNRGELAKQSDSQLNQIRTQLAAVQMPVDDVSDLLIFIRYSLLTARHTIGCFCPDDQLQHADVWRYGDVGQCSPVSGLGFVSQSQRRLEGGQNVILFADRVLDETYNRVIRFLENVKAQLDDATVKKNKLQEAYNDFVEKLKVRSYTKFD